MKGQFMLIGVLVVMFLLAGMLVISQKGPVNLSNAQANIVSQHTQNNVLDNIETELTLVTLMDSSNDTMFEDFKNFSISYATEKGFDLNITG